MEVLELIKRGEHRVSPSRLKKIIGENPKGYLKNNVKEGDALRLGKIVEALLFENKIIYSVLPKINDLCRDAGDFLYINNYSCHDTYILRYAESANYCSKMSDKVRIKRILDSGVESYLKELRSGKILISSELEIQAKALVDGLKNNPKVIALLDMKGEFQKYIEFEYNGVDCKGYIDYFTDRVIDLKVVTQSWKRSAKQFRWDIQGAFYNIPFSNIKNPLFIVARTYAPDKPLIVEMTDSDLEIAMKGVRFDKKFEINGEERTSSYFIEGIDQLLERFKFHSSEDLWDYPMEYYQNLETQYLNLHI